MVMAEELAESTGEKLKAKLAMRPSQEGEETQRSAKSMADLETILQEIREFHQEIRIDDVEKRVVDTEESNSEFGGCHVGARGAAEAGRDQNDRLGGLREEGECLDPQGEGRSGGKRSIDDHFCQKPP